MNLVGLYVQVHLADGHSLTGIFESISTNLEYPEIVLRMVKFLHEPRKVVECMIFKLIDIISINAEKVSFASEKSNNRKGISIFSF